MVSGFGHNIRGYKSAKGAQASVCFSSKKSNCLRAWMLCSLPFLFLTVTFASPAVVPTTAGPPGVVIEHRSPETGIYIGSPSIVILPNGDYLASHDLFGPNSTEKTSGVTLIFRSTDRGATWAKIATLHEQFWSNLFLLHHKLYLMGSSHQFGRIVIRQSLDDGATWTAPSYLTSGAGYHTAPVPIVQKNGRIWRAMEFHVPHPCNCFKAFVLSAPEDSNLLDPKNWSMTEQLPYPATETETAKWREGNAVIAPDGSVLDILRVDNRRIGNQRIGAPEKAAILKVDGLRLDFEGLVDLPGAAKKFSIRYDKVSRRYWTLSNPALKKFPLSAYKPTSVRNVLALVSSKDLHHWKIERILMSRPDPTMYGFQYVDWQFDGADIIAAVRTRYNDDHRGANYFTFYRVTNFRSEPEGHNPPSIHHK